MTRLLSAALILLLFTFGLGLAAPVSRPQLPIQEFIAVVDSVKQEFPAIKNSVVQVAELPDYIYAMTEAKVGATTFFGRVTFNELFASDRQKLENSTKHDVELGFHPPLGHCSGVQFIAYHEAAHLVDDSEGTSAHNALVNLFGDGLRLHGVLSGYSFKRADDFLAPGTINASEALAEAFAAVHCNGGNWAEKELNHMLQTRGKV
jgi:hypothetical protein